MKTIRLMLDTLKESLLVLEKRKFNCDTVARLEFGGRSGKMEAVHQRMYNFSILLIIVFYFVYLVLVYDLYNFVLCHKYVLRNVLHFLSKVFREI